MPGTLEDAMEEEMGANPDEFNPVEGYMRAYTSNQHSMDQLQKHDEGYEELAGLLQDLVQRTRHDIMVPLGPCAFMPGYLVHTNEVLVLLGDNWFAQRSVVQALQIIQRRRKHIKTTLQSYETQQANLLTKLQLTQQLKDEGDPALHALSSKMPPASTGTSRTLPSQQEAVSMATEVTESSSTLPEDPFSAENVAAARRYMDELQALEEAEMGGEDAEDEEETEEDTYSQPDYMRDEEMQAIFSKLNSMREISASEAAENAHLPPSATTKSSGPLVSTPADIYNLLYQAAGQGHVEPPPEGSTPEVNDKPKKSVSWAKPISTASPDPPAASPPQVISMAGDTTAFTGVVKERAAGAGSSAPTNATATSSGAAAPRKVSKFKMERMQQHS